MSDLQHILDRIPKHWGKSTSIGEGWHEIVLDLDRYLSQLFPGYEIQQIKEKFGGLRYYWEPGEDEWPSPEPEEFKAKRRTAERLERAAEIKASLTCEECGKPGKSCNPTGWWVKTLCPEHEQKRKDEEARLKEKYRLEDEEDDRS